MAQRTCSICGDNHYARGFCQRCYGRQRRSGELVMVQKHLPNIPWPESLLQRMEPQPNGCIYFTGHIDRYQGYGTVEYPGGTKAHRAAWTHFVGPIPEGMTVGHKCHDADESCAGGVSCLHRRCVNVEHLAIETIGENTRSSRNTRQGINVRKTHCPQGHPYDEENTYIDPEGSRECRICRRDAMDRYRSRLAGQTQPPPH